MKNPASPTLTLAQALIQRPSITPDDAGCLQLIGERLQALGFTLEFMRFGAVDNLWARRGSQGPVFCFAGHTDVVPTGPQEHWTHPPFAAEISADGFLYGRGAADMKGSIAAMLVAVEQFLQDTPDCPGSLAFLLTSDEEGPAINGTVKVIETLQARGEQIDWCLVGEPSSTVQLGDVIKNGRRGSLNGQLRIHGKQGHIAYPHLARNPIHLALPALAELTAIRWDEGNEFFPATSLQISNIHAGTGATNVIPGTLEVLLNFRFSTAVTAAELQQRTEKLLQQHALDYQLDWLLSGEPFLTSRGTLVDATCKAVQAITGQVPELSTSGGTSDGRFIAPTGAQVVELGPLNATIHQIDERVQIQELEQLTQIYRQLLQHLFG